MTNEQLRHLTALHRELRDAVANAERLNPNPTADAAVVVSRGDMQRWVEADKRIDEVEGRLRSFRREIRQD